MALPKHLDQSVAQLHKASAAIEAARDQAVSLESVRAWLVALTDFTMALSDVQRFDNESVHEKLHDLAARVGAKTFPGRRPRPPEA